MSLDDCRTIELLTRSGDTGALSVVEGETDVPFRIQRVFHVYGLTPGSVRGRHAHRALHEVLIQLVGSSVVTLHDGTRSRTETLNSPARALYIAPMTWIELRDFSAGAAYVVLCSHAYDESDYIRDYREFLATAARA